MSDFLSCTGLSPSVAGFPKTFPLESLNQLRGPNPGMHARRFGLFPFRSPLLWKSHVVFFSSGYLDVSVHRVPDAWPVSYTHLDVYKRQVQTIAAFLDSWLTQFATLFRYASRLRIATRICHCSSYLACPGISIPGMCSPSVSPQFCYTRCV